MFELKGDSRARGSQRIIQCKMMCCLNAADIV